MKYFYTVYLKLTVFALATGIAAGSNAASKSGAVALAPLKDDQAFSLLRVYPDLRGQPATLAALQKWEPALKGATSELNSALLNALISPASIPESLVKLSDKLQSDLSTVATEMNAGLSETEEKVFTIYVTPYNKIQGAIQIPNVPVFDELQALEFNPNTESEVSSLSGIKSQEQAYSQINAAIRSIQVDRYKNFQFAALAVHLRLLKNNIRLEFQMLGFLKGGHEEFPKFNEQVSINHYEVLTDPKTGLHPMVMIHVSQPLKIHKYQVVDQPKIVMNFGGFDGVLKANSSEEAGSFSLLGSKKSHQEDCKLKYSLVPTLFGSFAHKATGKYLVDKFLHNKFVRFRILSLELDSKTFKVSKLDVATGLDDYRQYEMLNCLSLPVVGKAFTDEANASIEDALKQLAAKDTATADLMERIYE